MLLIRCPYCEEERPELEFRNAGEAHIARSANLAGETRRGFRKILLHPLEPQGAHLRALAAHPWLRALLQRRARHGHRQFLMTYKAGEPKPEIQAANAAVRRAWAIGRRQSSMPSQRAAPAPPARRRRADGRADRIAGPGRLDDRADRRFTFDGQRYAGPRATRWPRRCSPTASIWSAARSNTTGRAASCRPAPRSPTRWSTIERDAARKTPNVRATVQELYDGLTAHLAEPLAVARLRRRRGQRPGVADVFGRLLLQDLHVAEGGLEERLRAEYPRRRRPWRRARPARSRPLFRRAMRIARCWCWAAARPASRQRWPRPKPACASSSATSRPEFGGALRFESRREDRRRRTAGAGRRPRSPSLPAMDNVRVLPRTTAFGYYAQNFVGLVERVSDHLAEPGHDLPRERLWQVRAKRVVLATGAIERHMVFADNDRPGIMLASAARTYLNHYGVAVGRNVGVYTANDSAYAAAIDLKKAGVDIAAIVDLRDNPTGPAVDEARGARHRDQPRPRGDPRRRQAARLVDDRAGRRTAAPERTIPVDAILMSAGWTPSVHLFSQSRGKVAFDDATKRFLPGSYAQDCVSVGACNGTDGLAGDDRRGAIAAGEKAAKDAGGQGRQGACKLEGRAVGELGRRHAGRRARRRRRHDGQGLRRFPERRHRQGHPPGGARGHALDRACQALHHQRHGDRPGQDVQHARPRHRRRDAGQGHSRRSG